MGRPKGARNKATKLRLDTARLAAEKETSPLLYLLGVMADENVPTARRDWAAAEAAKYCHPRMTAIAVRNSDSPKTVNTYMRIHLVAPEDRTLPGETIDVDPLRIDPPQ
jgi:hypothetical protein